MEKEMLVHLKLKEGKLETFMGWMQSDEGMEVRKSVAYPEKTVGAMIPDKSGLLFKVNVHNEAGMKEFVNGNNPAAKAIYACLLYTSPSPRDRTRSRMPSSA